MSCIEEFHNLIMLGEKTPPFLEFKTVPFDIL